MTGDLGVAIIGCGYMGDIHAESWDAHPKRAGRGRRRSSAGSS